MHIKGIMESRQKPTFVHATIIGHKIFQTNMTYFASLSPIAEQFACFQVCYIGICNRQPGTGATAADRMQKHLPC